MSWPGYAHWTSPCRLLYGGPLTRNERTPPSLFYRLCRTYGGLLGAGVRSALGMSGRTFGWTVGAAAGSAWLREVFHAGVRHSEAPGLVDDLCNAGGGLAAGYIATAGLALPPARRAFFVMLCSAGGAALPSFLAASGPTVRGQLSRLVMR